MDKNISSFMSQAWFRTTAFIIGLLLVVFVGVKVLGAVHDLKAGDDNSRTISVTGQAETAVIPDIATFSFTVSEESKDLLTARTNAAKKIDAAIASLIASGIAKDDIKTTSYNITPRYDYVTEACPRFGPCVPGKSVFAGYTVAQSITVKVRNVENAGKVIDGVASVGVGTLGEVSFGTEHPESIHATVRDEAITKARADAQRIASALGVRLGKAISFSEQGGSMPVPMYDRYAITKVSAAGEAAPNLITGQNTIQVSVQVTYQIR